MDCLPNEPTLLGRWLLDPDNEIIEQNGSPVKSGDFLIPGIDGRWSVVEAANGSPKRGDFILDFLPDQQDINALQALGGILLDSKKAAEGWLGWCSTSPLAPHLDQAITGHPFEDVIEKEIDHLDAVCCRPQTHIRIEADAVLVSKARKLDRNIYTRLATHTEDWLHRKITGVQPRRILAQIREEQWDLYENRISVRLVDHLTQWLRQRIRKVKRVRDDIFARIEDYNINQGINWRRSHRLCALWGESFEYGSGKDQADQTIIRLETLLYRTLRLMDSVLYRTIPRRVPASHILRMTNLFSNHDHYRGVARLWHAWSQHATQKVLSPSAHYREYQHLLRGFNAWCMLLIIRALDQIEIEASDDELEYTISPSSVVHLKSGHSLEWHPHEILMLSKEGIALVRFIPLLHALSSQKPNFLKECIAKLAQEIVGIQPWTIILHPAIPHSPDADLISNIGIHPPQPNITGAIDFIEVSPFSLDSVERVARAIRWAILVPKFLSYPPRIPSVPTEYITQFPNKLRQYDNSWILIQGINMNEMKNIEDDTDKAERIYSEKQEERERIDDELRQVRGNRDRMRELNIQKRVLLPIIAENKLIYKQLFTFKESLKDALSIIEYLQKCPICGQKSSLYFHEKNCFEVTCSDNKCMATWGLRYDPELRVRIPFMLPGNTTVPNDYLPQRVDDIFGCDILAVPTVNQNGELEFLPPRIIAIK